MATRAFGKFENNQSLFIIPKNRLCRQIRIGLFVAVGCSIDYADDVALLVDKKESFRAALVSMDEEASKFGLRVSWTKTKIQNLGSGPTPSPIIVDGNTFDTVEKFTWQYTVE